MSMLEQPDDIILDFMNRLSHNDLLSLCNSNQRFRNLCNKYILKKFDVWFKNYDDLNSALVSASDEGEALYVKILIDKGADPSFNKWLSLEKAINNRHSNIVRYLFSLSPNSEELIFEFLTKDSTLNGNPIRNPMRNQRMLVKNINLDLYNYLDSIIGNTVNDIIIRKYLEPNSRLGRYTLDLIKPEALIEYLKTVDDPNAIERILFNAKFINKIPPQYFPEYLDDLAFNNHWNIISRLLLIPEITAYLPENALESYLNDLAAEGYWSTIQKILRLNSKISDHTVEYYQTLINENT